MTYEIHADKNGKPYLKKVFRYRNVDIEGRGLWVEIGKANDVGIDRIIKANIKNGYLVLPDDCGFIRALVLTD